MKKLLAYMGRWQLSTVPLAIVISLLCSIGVTNSWIAAIIANLIGSLIFYPLDKFIFTSKRLSTEWDVDCGYCFDCKKYGRVYRIIRAKNYDKSNDPTPKWRCEKCSEIKAKEIL